MRAIFPCVFQESISYKDEYIFRCSLSAGIRIVIILLSNIIQLFVQITLNITSFRNDSLSYRLKLLVLISQKILLKTDNEIR